MAQCPAGGKATGIRTNGDPLFDPVHRHHKQLHPVMFGEVCWIELLDEALYHGFEPDALLGEQRGRTIVSNA